MPDILKLSCWIGLTDYMFCKNLMKTFTETFFYGKQCSFTFIIFYTCKHHIFVLSLDVTLNRTGFQFLPAIAGPLLGK
jgi:hypothetical protein